MTTYTAEAFLNSPAFISSTVEEAVKTMAKTTGLSIEEVKEAIQTQVPNAVKMLMGLIHKAAEHCAKEANAGRLWGR